MKKISALEKRINRIESAIIHIVTGTPCLCSSGLKTVDGIRLLYCGVCQAKAVLMDKKSTQNTSKVTSDTPKRTDRK